jgi:hypothetical protein
MLENVQTLLWQALFGGALGSGAAADPVMKSEVRFLSDVPLIK